jgi:RimJ/RimL family protein N-acetyltransferase
LKAVGKKMIQLKLMEEFDVDIVLKWNDDDKDFLKQWSNYSYPLTEQQIIDRINSHKFCVYTVVKDNVPLGTMQLFRFDNENNSAMAGCFLINPEFRGKGFGTKALRALIDIVFNDKGFDTLGLSVYDFNKSAQKSYEKCGFVKTGESMRPNGWIVYNMELKKNSISNGRID